MKKLKEFLIAPIFFNQSWFTRLLSVLIKEPLWLPSSDISLTFPYREKVDSISPKNKIDGLLCIRRCLQEQDIPSETADIIVQSWQPGTKKKYDFCISKWVQFSSERNFSPYEVTVNQILLFLYGLISEWSWV